MLEKYQQIVGKIEEAYNTHRAPELWGTREVSPWFFKRLRTEGFRGAWNYLVDQERTLGDLNARPEVKAMANLVGSTLLVLGAQGLSGVSEEELHEGEYEPSIRQRVGEAIFNITLGLLFFAQGEVSHMGYLGKDPSQWDQLYEAKLSKKEQQRVEREFDRHIDGCQMDTINRIYPGKLKPR